MSKILVNEIVVGSNRLSLPEPWRWQQRSGSWAAFNDVLELLLVADVRGDDGIQILVTTPTDCIVLATYVPAVVLALVVLANDGGTLNNIATKMTRYVTSVDVDDTEKS